MPDRYRDFTELAGREVEGRDWRVQIRIGPWPVLIMAPHGGTIEPYTDVLADAVAGEDFSFYAFVGLKTTDRWSLHLSSQNFDEPRALAALAKARVVLTVHGCRETARRFVCVGGSDGALRSRVGESLREAGFTLEDIPGMMGLSPRNICNRGGRGVQLEISYGLRKYLVENPQDLRRFVGAVRGGLREEGL